MGHFNSIRGRYLTIAIFITIANIFLDHFCAPSGIFLLPAVIIAVSIFLSLVDIKFNVYLQAIFTFSLIALNDAGIKLYGGGVHDSEGFGFITLFLFAGLIPGTIILFVSVAKRRNISIITKVVSISLFLLLTSLYLHFSKDLGFGRYYPINN